MAVAAAEMVIELTITAQSSLTLMNANVEILVRIVQIAKDFRRPSRVWIIHAPTYGRQLDPNRPWCAIVWGRTIDPGQPATVWSAQLSYVILNM